MEIFESGNGRVIQLPGLLEREAVLKIPYCLPGTRASNAVDRAWIVEQE